MNILYNSGERLKQTNLNRGYFQKYLFFLYIVILIYNTGYILILIIRFIIQTKMSTLID